jgi:integrase
LFQYAISQGWIKDNPCTNAIKPRKNKSIKRPPLEIEQIKDIINKTHIFSVYNAIIQFQIYTGMRIGETLALTWNDIDFDNLTININKTINYINYINQEFQVGPPKTDNGYRTIGINKTVLHILELVKQDQNIRKKDLEDVYMDKNLVFSNEIGDYIRRNSVNNHLKVIKKGTNYEYITVHFLRHANATLLLNSGVDLKMVSAHLGHNDIQTTANIYADVLSSQKHKIAQIIEINLENE